MNATQLPEMLDQMLIELNEISAIAEILKTINLEPIQVNNEVDISFLVNQLVESCDLWKRLNEAYSVEGLKYPDYLAVFLHDMFRPVSYIHAVALFLPKIDFDDTGFSQATNDLLRHSEVLTATFEKMNQYLVSLRETKE